MGAAILNDRTLWGPEMSKLRNPFLYSLASYTATDEWQLASVLHLAFRGLLRPELVRATHEHEL